MRCSLKLLTCVVSLIPLLSFSLTLSELESEIKRKLREVYGDKAKLKAITVYARSLPPSRDFHVSLRVSEGNPRGRATLLVNYKGKTLLFTVGLDLLWRCKVLVASEDLLTGERAYPWLFEEKEIYLERCPREVPGDLINHTLLKGLRKGEILRRRHLRRTPLVRSGEEVRVTLRRGNLEITLRGVVLESGFFGDTVRVRVGSRGKILRAVVVGEGSVEIRL